MNYMVPRSEPLLAQDAATSTFENLVATFLSHKDLKPSSEQSYRASFSKFMTFLHNNSVKNPLEKDIKEYKDYLMENKLSVFTVIAHISAVKSLFSFLARRNLYPDIAKDVKSPKKPQGFSRDALTKEQTRNLLQSASGDDVIAKRDLAIMSTLVRCGLRSIEIVRLDIGDLRRLHGVFVLFIHGKGRDSKDEFVVVTQEACKVIKEYLSLRRVAHDTEPLFVSYSPRNNQGRLSTRSIRRLVKKYLKIINLDEKELTCHSLRHTFATLALANKAPLLSVQKSMRHSNINTTIIYTHMIDRLKDGAEHYIDV